jgi:hypothetical protein
MTDEQWQSGLELKLHGARRVTILAWEAPKATKGSVVLISGSAALSQTWVRGSCDDQCGHHRAGQGFFRTRHQGQHPGE